MADIKSVDERSRNMSAIRSSDTGPEVYFRKLLFARGFRYRKNAENIIGHPDIYLAKYNCAIFIHGCFWHRHPGCKYAYIPKTRTDFWIKKFNRNIERDAFVEHELSKNGIRRMTIWECTIRKMQKNSSYEDEIIRYAVSFITGGDKVKEF